MNLAHNSACIVPVMLKPVDWNTTPFSCLNYLPSGNQALIDRPDIDEAWASVVATIRFHARQNKTTWLRSTETWAERSINRYLRVLLTNKLRTDSDFDAFCLDHFPSIKMRFSNGMDRVAKMNLLIELARPFDLMANLREY